MPDRPLFAKRHYEAIARTLAFRYKNASPAAIAEGKEIIASLCNLFAHDNPNFDAERFELACGF